jgi:hypothetical protein
METLEMSSRLFEVVDDGMILDTCKKVNGVSGKFIEFGRCADDEDGIFPRVSDYIRLINRMDDIGTSAFLTWIGNSKLKFDSGYCKVIRDSKWSDKATLIFETPIKVCFGVVGDEPIIKEVTEIYGEFTHEWFFYRNGGRQQDKANGFTIYFDIERYIK